MQLEDLKKLARRALDIIERELRDTLAAGPLLGLVVGDELRLIAIPGAQEAMESGDAKELLFGFIRYLARQQKADAVVIGTDSWLALPTPLGELNMEHYSDEIDKGFARLLSLGWVTRAEALQVVVQDEHHCVLASAIYRRRQDGEIDSVDEARINVFPQHDYAGRTKMFGDTSPHNLGEHGTVSDPEKAAMDFWKRKPKQ